MVPSSLESIAKSSPKAAAAARHSLSLPSSSVPSSQSSEPSSEFMTKILLFGVVVVVVVVVGVVDGFTDEHTLGRLSAQDFPPSFQNTLRPFTE